MMMQNVIAFRPRHAVCLNEAPLRRPRLLIRAAQAGVSGFRRNRDLRRALRTDSLPAPGRSMSRLREIEAELDLQRCDGVASYDLQRHVLVLIAILAEARALRDANLAPA